MRTELTKLRTALRPLYGDRETEAIIRIIFHHLKGWNLTDMLIHEPEPLSPFIKSEIDRILQRLLNHEPIQYITGEARFHGLELHVTPDVLIPRPETAELVDIIADDAADRPDLHVLDIATGSGCIAIALARTLRFPIVTALDISEPALKVARENVANLKVAVNLIHADIFSWPSLSPADGSNKVLPERESLDIIVSNPPYIDESEKASMDANVLDYEPHSALFVPDADPLRFYIRIAYVAGQLLKPDGRLYFEINPRHADDLKKMLQKSGFTQVDIIRDSYGKERFIRASRQ